MKRRDREFRGPGRLVLGAVGSVCGVLAWTAVAAVGAVIAIVVAATMMVIALVALAPLALSIAAIGARRSVRAAADPDLLEARHVGGHSWVAYAADARR